MKQDFILIFLFILVETLASVLLTSLSHITYLFKLIEWAIYEWITFHFVCILNWFNLICFWLLNYVYYFEFLLLNFFFRTFMIFILKFLFFTVFSRVEWFLIKLLFNLTSLRLQFINIFDIFCFFYFILDSLQLFNKLLFLLNSMIQLFDSLNVFFSVNQTQRRFYCLRLIFLSTYLMSRVAIASC